MLGLRVLSSLASARGLEWVQKSMASGAHGSGALFLWVGLAAAARAVLCLGSWESTPPGWARPSAHGPLADSLSLCPVAAGSGSGTSGRGSCYLSDEICSERKKRVVERTPPTGYQRLRQEPGDFRPEPLPAHSRAPRTPSLTPLVFLWFRPLPLRLGPFVREFHLPQ